MADTIQTIKSNAKKLAKMAASELADNVQFFKSARKFPASEFKPDGGGHSPGDTVSVRIPSNYAVGTTSFDLTSALQDIKERSVDLPLDIIGTVGFDLDSQQLAHDVNLGDVYDRFIKGVVLDIAASVESQMLQKATQNTANLVGTAGSTAYTTAEILAAKTKMSQFLCPKDKQRFLLGDASAMAQAVDQRKGFFQSSERIKEQYEQGFIGIADGFTWMENELLYSHTNGNDVAATVETGVVTIATGMSTLGLADVTANTGTVTKGSVFTIADVYSVHPQTKVSTGVLKQFVHTGATQTADASGFVTLTLDEPIYSSASGSLQNVSALPADEAAVTFVGAASTTYKQSLAFHKEAFRVCSVPLVLPNNAEFAEQATEDGVTVAIVRDFDVLTRKMITRVDFLGGLAPVRPRWACRITS